MYPRLFEIPLPFSIGGVDQLTIFSFGAMLVVAVLTAAWMTARELDRMYQRGRVGSVRVPVEDEKGRRKSRTRAASPSVLMGTIATIAVVAGVGGSKLFFILENLDLLTRDPLGTLFSTGGLTFYGGLLVAGAAIAWYVHKKGLYVWDFADALAPGLMLAYGIGRIGCHLAGDGDWGIPADLSAKPDWLPMWLWAETYPNAIIGAPEQAVYPTSLWEFIAAAVICAILWGLRKHPFKAGWLFSLYLVFNGVERFLIEMVRVNPEYELFGMIVTQAQVIAVFIFLAGVVGLFLTWRRRDKTAEAQPAKAQVASPAA